MARKARIENGMVVEVKDADPFPPFHSGIEWVSCSSDVAVGWVYDGSDCAPPPAPALEIVRDQQAVTLKLACRNAIIAGVNSDALGAAHHYPLSETDQSNLQAVYSSATANSSDPEWAGLIQCQGVGDPGPTYKLHTAAQAKVVGDAAIAHKDAHIVRLGQRIAAVQSAYDNNDAAGIQAVIW